MSGPESCQWALQLFPALPQASPAHSENPIWYTAVLQFRVWLLGKELADASSRASILWLRSRIWAQALASGALPAHLCLDMHLADPVLNPDLLTCFSALTSDLPHCSGLVWFLPVPGPNLPHNKLSLVLSVLSIRENRSSSLQYNSLVLEDLNHLPFESFLLSAKQLSSSFCHIF